MLASLDPGVVGKTLVFVVLLQLLWHFFLYPRYVSPLRKIPAAKVDWSTFFYRWLYSEPTPDQVMEWIEQTPHQGVIRYPGIGGAERVLLLSPAAVREVLVTKAYDGFQKPPLNRQRLGSLFGEGLLVADGEDHRTQRRKLLPAFAPRNIRALVPTFWAKACELSRLLEQHVGGAGTDIELAHWTSRTALDVIGIAAWGRDFGALADPGSDLVTKYNRMFRGSPKANRQAKLIYSAALVVPMKTLRKLYPCEFFQNAVQGSRAIRSAVASIIEKKKRSKNAADHDILSHAMSTQEFDDMALQEQMLNVLAAGHETSSLATTWACFLLSKHETVQDRLRDEIRSHLPSPHESNCQVTAEMLDSLPYLRAVTRETLRLIPTAPVIRREAKENTSIQGYAIPCGTSVIAFARVLNTNPSEWGADPKDFYPERWLNPEAHAVDNTFLTFNTGPRSCIGEGFARAEVAALVAALVSRFRIRLTHPDIEPDVIWGITLKPVGLKFHISPISI